MIDLAKVINENTFTIADTHMGHAKVLQFEPLRIKFLSDYNSNVSGKCSELIDLMDQVPQEDHRQHRDINNLCKDLIDHHDKMLTEKWNNEVSDKDTVLHLGDFAFRGIEEHTKNLNGKKILLRGNHDLKSGRHYVELGWKDVIETTKLNLNGKVFEMVPNMGKNWNGFLTTINGWKILFSHYPIRNSNEWDIKKYGHITDLLDTLFIGFEGEINIHGHVHSLISDFDNALNVSIEHCPDLKPIKIGELIGSKK